MTTASPTPTATPTEFPDSYGTEFVTLFPWNNGNQTEPPRISMDIINPNNQSAIVSIKYPEMVYNGTEFVECLWLNTTVTIPATSSYTVSLPLGIAW